MYMTQTRIETGQYGNHFRSSRNCQSTKKHISSELSECTRISKYHEDHTDSKLRNKQTGYESRTGRSGYTSGGEERPDS